MVSLVKCSEARVEENFRLSDLRARYRYPSTFESPPPPDRGVARMLAIARRPFR